jgi:hypothetical protein
MFAEMVFYIHQNPVVAGLCMKQNNGYTAAQNILQKMRGLLNWLNFVKEDLPC